MKQAPMIIGAALLVSVIAGAVAGVQSVIQNEYWEHGHRYLALDELTRLVDRLIYVVLASTAVLAAFLGAVRLAKKSVWMIAAVVTAAAGFGVCVEVFDLDYRADLVWNEMPLAAHVGIVLMCVISADSIVGKRWLRFLHGKAAWRAAVACALFAVSLNVTSWLWFKSLQKELSTEPNILIITVDALRADHVRCLGYERETTPVIDSLAASGVLFTQAASNSNATRSTVPAIFTMRYPSVHGIMGADGRVLSPRFTTLAELLRDRGYATHAYMPNGPLRRIFNFDQGFDVYDDRILGLGELERFDSAVPINASIAKWLDRNAGTKFFMYIHYIEPHSPYQPPPPYDRMFYGPEAAARRRPITAAELERLKKRSGETSVLDSDDLNFYIAQYDAEIRYVDDQIGILLEHLRSRGVLDNTAIFVTADHGEAFLEHGHWMHTTASLHDEVVHVPLVAHLPMVGANGVRLEAPVLTFDISATILDLVGIAPDAKMQAQSFLPLIRGDAAPQREYTFSESPRDKVLRNREWKLRVSEMGRSPQELFYLPDDPHEKHNLVLVKSEKAKEMMQVLMTFVNANNDLSAGREVGTIGLDRETVDQLKALGYTQ